jgi:hypothetical protein
MILGALDLWNPTHVTGIEVLITAFLLGMVHGITPDEHTWPITFSYAIGSYSTWRGLRAGLLFSLAFTLQRALASELCYLGLARVLMVASLDYAVYIVVGAVMAISGVLMLRRGCTPFHVHLFWRRRYGAAALHTGECNEETNPTWLQDPRPWMPLVHGFIAGWGFGAFALIVYTVLAPAMPSAAWGWVPGALFGVGTAVVQALAGALFGWIASRHGLPQEAIRQIALTTASRTLTWGGVAFVLGGGFGLAFPHAAGVSISTGFHIHNLAHFGLPLVLVIFAVVLVGIPTLVKQTLFWNRRIRQEAAHDTG